jgi:hypothetical protein
MLLGVCLLGAAIGVTLAGFVLGRIVRLAFRGGLLVAVLLMLPVAVVVASPWWLLAGLAVLVGIAAGRVLGRGIGGPAAGGTYGRPSVRAGKR